MIKTIYSTATFLSFSRLVTKSYRFSVFGNQIKLIKVSSRSKPLFCNRTNDDFAKGANHSLRLLVRTDMLHCERLHITPVQFSLNLLSRVLHLSAGNSGIFVLAHLELVS